MTETNPAPACCLALIILALLLVTPVASRAGSGPAAETERARQEYELALAWRDWLAADTRPVIGLALGGGGGRGMAHIGVLRALEEAAIPVERLSGASIGAFVGSLYASGASIDQIEQLAATTDWHNLIELKNSRMGVYSTRPLERFINYYLATLAIQPRAAVDRRGRRPPAEEEMSDVTFAQLRRPFACTATDLFSGVVVVFDTGSVAHAVRASCSFPGLFEPVEEDDGRLLVDGGVLANLPVALCRRLGAEQVIAVEVDSDTPTSIVGLMEVLTQIINIQGHALTEAERRDAVHVILPAVGSVKATDLLQTAFAVRQGEIAAWVAVPVIKRRLLGRTVEDVTVMSAAEIDSLVKLLIKPAKPRQTAIMTAPPVDLTPAVEAACRLGLFRYTLELVESLPADRRTPRLMLSASLAALRQGRADLLERYLAPLLMQPLPPAVGWRLAAAAVDARQDTWHAAIRRAMPTTASPETRPDVALSATP